MKKPLVILALVAGIVLVILAFIYWTTPASGLPSYFPGYEPGVTSIHFKHGLASLILAILLFIYTWFATGPRSKKNSG